MITRNCDTYEETLENDDAASAYVTTPYIHCPKNGFFVEKLAMKTVRILAARIDINSVLGIEWGIFISTLFRFTQNTRSLFVCPFFLPIGNAKSLFID